MYGLVKEIKKINSCIKYSVFENHGKYYSFLYQPSKHIAQIEKIRLNERVKFTVKSGNKIRELLPAYKENVNGRVIKVFYDNSGLIETERGEILRFSSNNDKILLPHQIVNIKPISPAANSDTEYGYCKDIKVVENKELTEDIKKEIAKIIRENFESGEEIPISEIQKYLYNNGIAAADYGYLDIALFLEQFTNVIYLNQNKKTARVIKEEELSDNYADAIRVLQNQGYKEPTLLQKRVFSDTKFWNSNRVLIIGSTSSGKTAIPLTKYLMDFEKSHNKPKLLIAVNLRTLTTQMQETIQSRLQEKYNLNMQISTSEYIGGDNDIKNGDVDIAIVIYEKLFIFASSVKGFFAKYDHLLLDEAAIVADPERGAKVDVILAKADEEPKLKITMLGTPYYNWEKYIHRYNLYPIYIFSRPVPVYEYFYYPVMAENNYGKKDKRYLCTDCCGKNIPTGIIPQNWQNTIKSLCINEFKAKHKTIVFVFSQTETRRLSQKIYGFIKSNQNLPTPPKKVLDDFITGFLKYYHLSFEELKGYFDTSLEYEALYYGITFHNASLPEKMRIAIETEFLGKPHYIKDGIKIVTSTDTLAYGLNSNVDSIIITQMQRYALNQYQKIPYNTYQNCIGRSGRLGYCNYGTSYAFITEDFEKKYFDENAEPFAVPQKVIDYYTKGIFNDQEYICGTLGSILSNAESDLLAFYILSLFSIDNADSYDNILTQLNKIPKTDDCNQKCTEDSINEALEMLINEKLIMYSKENNTYDDIYCNEQKRYQLTAKGRSLKGYAIRMKSYKKLCNLIDTLIDGEQIYPVDFVMALSQIKEFSDSWKNLLITYQKGKEHQENEKRRNHGIDVDCYTIAEKGIQAVAALIDYILPEFYEKNGFLKVYITIF